MPGGLRPVMIPSGPSAMSRTAAASVTIENTMSEVDATARGLSAKRMPTLISGSALARERFQPVTAWPAAISRGTMPAPMAPSPMNPILIAPRKRVAFVCPGLVARSPHGVKRNAGADEQLVSSFPDVASLHPGYGFRGAVMSQSGGCGFHSLAAVAVGPQHVVSVDRDVEIVAVRVDRPILGIEAVARPLQRRSIALVLEALDDLGVILDLEAEMVKARGLAIHLVGVDGEVEIAVGQRDAAVAGPMLDREPHDLDVEFHQPFDVGGVEDDVTNLGHGSSRCGGSGDGP